MYQALVRFALGGLLIAIIPLVGQRLGQTIAGIVLLFPAVTFAGLLFIGLASGMPAVATTSVGSVIGLPTVLAFLLVVNYSAKRGLSLSTSLLFGLVAWFLVATPIAIASQRSANK